MKTLWQSFRRGLAPLVLALAVSFASLHAADRYLPVGEPDAIALLAPPPQPDSPEQAADLAEVRTISHSAPSNDVESAMTEKKFSAFTFAPEIGDFFRADRLPKTDEFFHTVQKEAAGVVETAKDHWKRPRPYVTDPTLAEGKPERSFSYPSGHSTESMVLGLVLGDLFPDKRDVIVGRARSIGWHRVELARHYPTDIYAGRVLALAIVREMKHNLAYQRDFEAVKAEVSAASKAGK